MLLTSRDPPGMSLSVMGDTPPLSKDSEGLGETITTHTHTHSNMHAYAQPYTHMYACAGTQENP